MTTALRTYPPRQAGIVARHALDRATDLVVMVRDEGTVTVAEYLDRLTRADLYALTVTLAAMVPDGAPLTRLLAWTDNLTPQEPPV